MAKSIKPATTTVSSADKGAPEGYTRRTFIVNKELINKIDAIVYWDRNTLKNVMEEMQRNYIRAWEKKNGVVQEPKK